MLTPGVSVNMPYDIKVAREFDRISRELANAKRFGDPTADAIARLRHRIMPATHRTPPKQELHKKQSAFGLNVSWKRSPDKRDSASRTRPRVDVDDGIFGGERKSKVREVMRQLWFDEVDVTDVTGMTSQYEDDGDDIGIRGSRARRSGRSC
jgi:hypothetical protein